MLKCMFIQFALVYYEYTHIRGWFDIFWYEENVFEQKLIKCAGI